MSQIRVTKQFQFEMAHALFGYDGPCRQIHGHSYKLEVTLIGKPIDNPNSPKYGMVVDFSDLKTWVHENIINIFDHALLISDREIDQDRFRDNALFDRLMVLNYQPSSENILMDFVNRLSKALPPDTRLHSMRLYETASSYAEWVAADNQ